MAEFEPCAHVCAECGDCVDCCPGHIHRPLENWPPTPAEREEQRDRWRQAASQHARDKRTRRARRPPPEITGIRVDPRRQP